MALCAGQVGPQANRLSMASDGFGRSSQIVQHEPLIGQGFGTGRIDFDQLRVRLKRSPNRWASRKAMPSAAYDSTCRASCSSASRKLAIAALSRRSS